MDFKIKPELEQKDEEANVSEEDGEDTDKVRNNKIDKLIEACE